MMASIRSRATRAHSAGLVDGDPVAHLALDEALEDPGQMGGSMRNMVEHGHTSGSRETTVLSGVSSSSRLTRWISVATPMTDPAGAAATAG